MRTPIRTYAPLLLSALLATGTAAASASNDGVISSLADFEYDENSRLASHTLVYTEGCADVVEGLFADGNGNRNDQLASDRYKLHPVSGEARLGLFPQGGMLDGSDDTPITANECRAICLERGVDSSLVGAAMPHRHFSGDSTFSDWFNGSCRKVEVCFMNYHSKTPMKMKWVTPQGQEKEHGSIKYGERSTRCIESFLGHRFLFRDGDTNEILLDITIEYALIIAVGNSPDYTGRDRDFETEIESTLRREWKRHELVKRTCSPLGFKKGRLPDDVFASMQAFYYNNAKYRVREEWSGKGVFVNWWEVDVYFIQIPWKLKGMWQSRLLDLVAAWTGTELEQTDMYGLRRYEEGARLLTHVDRETTHAFSLIVNVAQGNLSEPWAIEVHDHADRLHEVTMQPGDIVYYESAKCLHGRNKPLKGKGAYYVNLFTHYRPVGDPAWLHKPNPEGTPEPLIDVGECKLEGSINDVGIGAVKCDDDGIGPYLSPSMFTATSGTDLWSWWKSVGPEAEGHDEL